MTSSPKRFGFVALLGATNSGKSTLLNRLVSKKVSIVSRKVQTTRMVVRGIVTHGESQIVFVDTPGIFKPRRRLDRAMISAAWRGSSESDSTLVLVDSSRGLTSDIETMLRSLGSAADSSHKHILVLNKIDLVPRSDLLELSSSVNELATFDRTFMVSALRGDGCSDLLDYLATIIDESPWHYPTGSVTDFPVSMFCSEVTREHLYDSLHQEIPYALHVATESYEERPDSSVRIDQVIYLRRSAHKKIVLGRGGQKIKQVSQSSRREIESLLGIKVHLFLYVKVRENWLDDREFYDSMGLDFDSE